MEFFMNCLIILSLILIFGGIIIGFLSEDDGVGCLSVSVVILGFIIGLIAIGWKESRDKMKTPTEPKNISKVNYNSSIDVDSIYESGYRRGQIDCQNDSFRYKRIMNDDGEVYFQELKLK